MIADGENLAEQKRKKKKDGIKQHEQCLDHWKMNEL